MEPQTQHELLHDHGDMRPVTADFDDVAEGRNNLVHLDQDHPGFRDAEYRFRRNQIARIAQMYKPGTPIPDAPYTEEEHGVWREVWHALEPAHQQHACTEYLECLKKLDLPKDRIPQMREVTSKVEALSGFRLEPVAGLVEARVFLESLADGIFLSTQYIRHHSTPLYTPEPDVVHEIAGHALTLANEQLAELNRQAGLAAKRTKSPEAFDRLSRVYWFTIEFGVLREHGKLKAYGTGLLSSAGELSAMHSAEVREFDLEAAAHAEYDPTKFQPLLFCAESFDEMFQKLRDYLLKL